MNRLVPIGLFFSVIAFGVLLNVWGKLPTRKSLVRISPGLPAPTMAREEPAPPKLWIPDTSKAAKSPQAEFKKRIDIEAEARRAPAAAAPAAPAAPGNSALPLPLPTPGPVITWDAVKAEADYKHEMDTRAFYVKVVFSAVALLAALVIIFGKSHFPGDSMKWAYGIAGTLTGYWLK
jgi:hypothetical protein